ncbi:hypothetical protein QTN47_20465 [Danxiaibacter flavus]|uniref:Uncharacterized protein n=1 Tax=Danxiaibacter flavus TaxID=3049108 RepID=A0ABV3ZJB6_9BACT|nr:hypothetical protein QNM32_20470 [Chitinophagaceae bacterium DXS]
MENKKGRNFRIRPSRTIDGRIVAAINRDLDEEPELLQNIG